MRSMCSTVYWSRRPDGVPKSGINPSSAGIRVKFTKKLPPSGTVKVIQALENLLANFRVLGTWQAERRVHAP